MNDIIIPADILAKISEEVVRENQTMSEQRTEVIRQYEKVVLVYTKTSLQAGIHTLQLNFDESIKRTRELMKANGQ